MPALLRFVAGAHAALLLWTNGRLLGCWFGTPVLILETVGRRSGQPRTTPLVYLRDGENLVVVPANGGAPREPDWWLNLRAAGTAVAVIGRDRFHVRPREATGTERERLWRRFAAVTPVEGYQLQAHRRLPVVVLAPVTSPGSDGYEAVAWSAIADGGLATVAPTQVGEDAAGLGAGLVHGLRTADVAHQLPRVLGGALVQLPAVWVLAGIAVALFGLAPRLTVAAWGALVAFLLIGQFGPLLGLDQRVLDLSPFSHLPQLPGGAATTAPLLWLAALAAALIAAGLIGLRRRDVGS